MVKLNRKNMQRDPHFGVLATFAITICMVLAIGCDDSLQSADRGNATDDLVQQASKIIEEGLASQNPLIRAGAIEVVATTGRLSLMPKVQRLLADDFIVVRFAAALAVGDLKYRPAGNAVKHVLAAPDQNTKIAAAYAAFRLGNRQSLKIIKSAIADSDQTVRANAALLLGKSGDESSLKPLYWAMKANDSDYKVRFQAIEAIARLGDEKIIDKLWMMIISAFADDRIMGLKALGALGTPKAKDILVTKLDDDILEVRLAAAEQLGMLGDRTGEAEVLKIFKKNLTAGLDNKDLERINVLTALAIGRIGTPRLTRFLPRLLEDKSEFVRIAAAMAVFQSKADK